MFYWKIFCVGRYRPEFLLKWKSGEYIEVSTRVDSMSNTPAPATASSANASGAIRLQFGSIPVSKIWERVELGDKVG
jgi:hypothetical protein